MKQWIALLTLGLCAAPALASEEAEPVPTETSATADDEPIGDASPAPAPSADGTAEALSFDAAEPVSAPVEPEGPAYTEAEEPVSSPLEEIPAEPERTGETTPETEDSAYEEAPALESEDPAFEEESAAAGEEIFAAVSEIIGPMDVDLSDLPIDRMDGGELFAGYVDKVFAAPAVSVGPLRGSRTMGSTLGEKDRYAYDVMKPVITGIANGSVVSTAILIPLLRPQDNAYVPVDGGVFTRDELHVSGLLEDPLGTVTETAKLNESGKNKVNPVLQQVYSRAYRALMADCPYELYWYNKTKTNNGGGLNVSFSYVYSVSGDDPTKIVGVTVTSITCYFSPSKGYAGTGDYTVDLAKTGAASAAAANAQSIVDEYASKTDVGKLVAYRDRIRALTGYNYDAANDSSTPYGDPWQLIWVFDGDPETKVVCEGYSKAFQYLCDLSSFQYDVQCYCAQGYLGSGAHMWNIVIMPDGWNYLVDVTNYRDGLFLDGYERHDSQDQYTYVGLNYQYNNETQLRLGSDILALSPVDYGAFPGDVNGDHVVDVGDLLCLLKHINGRESAGYKPAFGDVTGDGKINLADLLRLLKKIVLQNAVELHYDGDADLR